MCAAPHHRSSGLHSCSMTSSTCPGFVHVLTPLLPHRPSPSQVPPMTGFRHEGRLLCSQHRCMPGNPTRFPHPCRHTPQSHDRALLNYRFIIVSVAVDCKYSPQKRPGIHPLSIMFLRGKNETAALKVSAKYRGVTNKMDLEHFTPSPFCYPFVQAA